MDMTPSKVAPRGKDPAQRVYFKFLFFSTALFVAPLTAYFFAKDRWFSGNATYAGGLAALVVNLVLAAYIVAAFLEDKQDTASPTQPKSEREATLSKKDQ